MEEGTNTGDYMKASNVIKKLSKLGTIVDSNPEGTNKQLSVQGNKSEISIYIQDGDAIIFSTRRLNDVSDCLTDYHAGSTHRNMKHALERFAEMEA